VTSVSEDVPEEEVPEPGEPEPRRYPSTVGGALYILVLVVCIGGIVLATTGDWRFGVKVVAGALGGAAVARLLLPTRDAGMLAVRHKAIDVTLLAALGGLLYFLAVSIPDQPD
jgi:hypothetical protein